MEKLKHFAAWATSFMFPKKTKKKTPLLYHWTKRYLITLVSGLLIIGVVSVFWIHHNTVQNKLELTKMLSQELADRVINDEGEIMLNQKLPFILEERTKFLNPGLPMRFYIKNSDGEVISPEGKGPSKFDNTEIDIVQSLNLPSEVTVKKIEMDSQRKDYVVISPILYEKKIVGAVYIFQPVDKLIDLKQQDYYLVALLLGSLALLGWLVIYFLSKKLAKPVLRVAEAAEEVIKGNYEVELNDDVQEKELYQLMNSFKGMTTRLEQLETLRTQLLAGVTHELKTPITSVSALVQAVRDDIVKGEKQKEFLQMALKESERLQSMVEDLISFNTFSTGSVKVAMENINVTKLIKEIAYQWEIVHLSHFNHVNLKFITNQDSILTEADPLRTQQILVNLLNNSLHAVKGRTDGEITVSIYQDDNWVSIEVEDNGYGISVEEQPNVFERFYRGKNKKHVERGLGLGLPYSLILAKAQGGNLSLKESSENGTTFLLQLPKR
ncbi:HAMP domain-containing sensor histidine kinase [Neobacillus sp. LXY-4]|uniref:HAMP domain-containing sensor histidine kinase n=1 Tax=Neobacillus sp. LXY-4 TaxID=3379826 RepID=UPI003EDF8816